MIKQKIGRIIIPLLILATLLGGAVTAQAESLNKLTNIAAAQSSTVSEINTSWGLGKTQTEYISNNKPYDWYIDQGNTGKDSNNNCGPTSATMSLKWQNRDFYKTVEDARNTYPRNDGWWYSDDVVNYLKLNGAQCKILQDTGENLLKTTLEQGNILILCIDTTYIPYNNNSEQRVGRFYDYKGGHFIVVKGYRVVDGKTYFEVYDPNNWGARYQDGQEKGKDRYYLSQDLMNAMSNWWNYLIVVENKGTQLKTSLNATIFEKTIKKETEVDITKIKHACGR